MGIYPIIQSENIKKLYGYIIIVVGVIVLLGGFADFKAPITDFYSFIFSESGILISLMVIAALSYVIVASQTNQSKLLKKRIKVILRIMQRSMKKNPSMGKKLIIG